MRILLVFLLSWALSFGQIQSIPASSSSGSVALLGQQTASASASLNFTSLISATYDEYIIEFINVIPATNSVSLRWRVSTDNGGTYDSSANYSWDAIGWSGGGSGVSGNSGQTSSQVGQATTWSNNANWGISGSMRIYAPANTGVFKNANGMISGLTDDGVPRFASTFQVTWEQTTAINAFQFFFSSGNITSGTIRVYGVAK